VYKHHVHVKGYIQGWPSMPSPHACMPLFTTWYALIPGIILCLTGGIRPYAPRHRSCFVFSDMHKGNHSFVVPILETETLLSGQSQLEIANSTSIID
jgi:hypothetical protein